MEPSEAILFRNLAARWYDPITEPLFTMNKLRVPAIVEGLESIGAIKAEHLGTARPLRGLSILDVGCGGGFISEPLAKLGAQVVGIDGVPELIEVAKRHAAEDETLTNLTYIAEAVQDFAVKCDDQFDVVLSFEVLDHVVDHRSFLKATTKFLKPGGSLFLTTMEKSWTGWLYCIILPEYVFKWIPRGSHHYKQFISAVEVESILATQELTTKCLRGLYYSWVGKYWYWTKSPSTWYFMHSVKK